MELPDRYKRLIALGIDSSANLPDLNDMTDRSPDPEKPSLKPWTSYKTVSTSFLIDRYRIKNEETLFKKFQEESKIPIQTLTDLVYEHQLKYFGNYRHDKDTIFKYAYCSIIVNSLKGKRTEKDFDLWARTMNISSKKSPPVLDQQFHTDRLQIDNAGKVTAFISIKPNSFHRNFLKYTDVFAGLQVLTKITQIPWIIYYRDKIEFKKIDLFSLDSEYVKAIEKKTSEYSIDERKKVISLIKNL